MSKIIFTPAVKKEEEKSEGRSRITIQLRAYDAEGNYDRTLEGKSNQTIHIKDTSLSKAYELLKSSIFNSNVFSKDFEIEE